MKKRLMSTLLMGAFFLASTSMFVSCKDYDDDINANTKAIQNVETSLKEQIATLNSALQQEKTAAAAAHSQYEDAIAKAQAAADAANKSLSDALVAAATHATTSYVDDAVSKGTADKATVSQLNDAIGNLQTTLNAAIDGKASTADLNSAIAAVNDKIAALQGDIAAATNAQNTLSATLTAAINAVDQKVDTKASTEAVAALETVLKNVQQSMQTKADVQEAIAAATANLATNASVAEKIQAAAKEAASDVNLAKAELQAYADKAATAAATEAAATAKAEAIASAIQSAQNLEEKLTTSINQLQKDGAAADAQLQKNLSDSVAVLAAKIGGVNTNLSKLIDINANAIEKNLAAIENINLQIDALNRFTGLLEDKNVVSLKDSLRITYAELQAAKKTLGDELIRIETKVDENALAYAAALLTQKNELTARIDSLRDNYATEEELEGAVAATTLLIAAVDNRIDELVEGDITTLKNKVKAIEDNIGEASIAAMLQDIEDINKTITVSGLGKIENLDEILEDLQGQIDDLDGALSEYKEANDKRVKALEDAGFISETAIDGKIATAVSGINTELGKYVQKAEIDQFLTGTKVVAALQTAGFALSSDLDAYVKTETLDNYLKKTGQESFDAIVALGFISHTDAETLANNAREDAKTAANENLQEAINAYDAQLAQALAALFAQISGEDANGDDAEEAIELPTAAKEAIEALKAKFEDNGGLSPQIANEIWVLQTALDGKLTSLVFYPETYYGGIEAIEITALKIENTYGLENDEFDGTALEEFMEIKQKSREFDLFPNGYAKYHINPVNADLTDYTLAFIDHTAKTRSAAEPYLIPTNEKAAENYRDANDVLWVEFENNPIVYNAINAATNIPGMGHYTISSQDADEEIYGKETHFTYGEGEVYQKGIVTALTAHKDTSYVASDYALLVPVTIQQLVLANTKFGFQNDRYETSELKDDAFDVTNRKDYFCNAANTFHLHRKVLERIGDDEAINKLNYKEKFDLKKLVETHFVNSASSSASVDEKVDDDLFKRLHLAYRFKEIDYTTMVKYEGDDWYDTWQHFTSESKFITLLNKDEDGYSDGEGYFNQVTEHKDENGTKVLDANNEFGGQYKTANDACLGRQPVVRVELYNTENGYVYAIGYLKLEISKDIDRDTEAFISTGEGHLFASCDGDCGEDADAIYLRWDQIQAQLNEINDGEGLSPKDWNTYEVADTEPLYLYEEDEDGNKTLTTTIIGYTQTQYASVQPTNVVKNIFEIEKNYDKDNYPYYQLGVIEKVGDQDTQEGASHSTGVWTDVLKWKFCTDDYKALFYDAVMRDAIDENGTITMDIWRYVKLTSSDSSNPDLIVGIRIPAGSIHFPAGTIGRVKNAYWKEAASNKEPSAQEDYKDLVLNVDLNIGNATGTEAAESEMVEKGWFYNRIVKNFYGEQILVDLTNAINAIPEAYRSTAEGKWKGTDKAEEYYKGSEFYFRMPDANDANEKKVYSNGEWVVNGMSGATYTLQVTELQQMCSAKNYKRYWTYGRSICITKINGVPVTEADGAVYVNLYDNDPSSDELNDSKFLAIPFIIVNPSTSLVYMKIAKNGVNTVTIDGNDYEVSDEVATYAQDMLNYAKHNESAKGTFSETARPYNMQLTAFMEIVPTNSGKTIVEPGQMKPFKSAEGRKYGSNPTCYIIPGYLQGEDCAYCYTETSDECKIADYDGCFAPVVNDGNKFAIRFYEPVYIGNNLKGVEITDAMLADKTKMQFSYEDFIYLEDWAGYHSKDALKKNTSDANGTLFSNFVSYYGIKVSQPEEMTEEYWADKQAQAIEDAAASVNPADYDLPADFPEKLAAAAEALNADDPEDAADVLDMVKDAEALLASMEAGKFPSGFTVNLFGDDYNVGGMLYKTSISEANQAIYDAYKEVYNEESDALLDEEGAPLTWANWLKSDHNPDAAADEVPAGIDGTSFQPLFIDIASSTATSGEGLVYSAVVMDGTSDPYTLAKSPSGTTDAYKYFKEDLSNVEIVTISESSYSWNGTEYTTKAAAQEAKDKAVLAYQLWQKDVATFASFYGASRSIVAAAWQDEVTKKKITNWKYEYTKRSSDTEKTPSGLTLGNAQTDDPFDELNKLTTASQADLTADNWGVTSSKFNTYLEYLDQYNALLVTDGYKAKKDAWDALSTGTRTGIANYAYVTENGLDGENPNGESITALEEFLDMMAPEDGDEDALVAKTGDPAAWSWVDDTDDDVDEYLDAVADAKKAAKDLQTKTPAELAADAWKDLYKTDLGLSQSARTKPATLAALKTAIANARTIREAAPNRLKFEITDYGTFAQSGNTITGTIKFDYNNNNANTNVPFNIYVPFDVTYNYLDRDPLKVRVWAIVTVSSTKANTDTTPTTSARRK